MYSNAAYMTDRLGRRLSQRRIERRRTIMAVTLGLIASKGYDAVTVREIAAESSVSKKTLYDIYGSKDDLLAAAVSDRIDAIMSRIEATASGRGFAKLLDIVRMLVDAIVEMPSLSRAVAPRLIENPASFKVEQFFNIMHRQALLEMAEDGQFVDWASIDLTVRGLLFEHIGLLNMWAARRIADQQLCQLIQLGACRMVLPMVVPAAARAILQTVRRLQSEAQSSEALQEAAAAEAVMAT